MKIRVLIADDHPIILSGAEALLRDSPFEVVAKLDGGAAALAAIDEVDPEIVILDVQMPECSGLDVLRILRDRGDGRPIILLTAGIGQSRAAEAIALGVSGLVLKDSAPDTLIQCLEAVREGRQWIDPAISLVSQEASSTAPPALPGLELISPRERDVAELVIRGMRNRDIASQLGIAEGTVKVHLYKIYEKLGVSSRTELLIHAAELGRD